MYTKHFFILLCAGTFIGMPAAHAVASVAQSTAKAQQDNGNLQFKIKELETFVQALSDKVKDVVDCNSKMKLYVNGVCKDINAAKAQNAEKAKLADRATKATNADKATKADKADKAKSADSADYASLSKTSKYSGYATAAGAATTADYATKANKAVKADLAALATKANTAKEADSADSSDYAKTAGRLATESPFETYTKQGECQVIGNNAGCNVELSCNGYDLMVAQKSVFKIEAPSKPSWSQLNKLNWNESLTLTWGNGALITISGASIPYSLYPQTVYPTSFGGAVFHAQEYDKNGGDAAIKARILCLKLGS